MFQELFTMLSDNQMLTISLLRRQDKLAVSVLPQSPHVQDAAKAQIIPLNLLGTPGELDASFIHAISTPIKKASGILMNMEQYEQKTDKAASESKALKETTEKIAKAIKEAEALEADKPREALIAYKKIGEQDKYNSKVIHKIKMLEKKLSEGSLFGVEEITTFAGTNDNTPPSTDNIQNEIKTEETPTLQVASAVQVSDSKPQQVVQTPPMDMFAQAVTASQAQPVTSDSKVNVEDKPIDMENYNQFLQFMAMQNAHQ